jgi:hypothetical protein
MRGGPWLVVAAMGAAGGAPAAAEAAESAQPVSLAWNAPAGCPSRDAVLADVNAILGGPTSHHAAARADVAQIAPQHWSVHVATDVDGAQGERTLEADSCESLAKATALILAWTVDPIKARAAALAAQPAPPPRQSPERPAAAPAPSSSSIPLAAVVAVSGMGDVGTLPSVGGGVELTLGALVGPLRFEMFGDYWGAQDSAHASAQNGDVFWASMHLLEGALRACFRWRLVERFEMDPCAAAALVHVTSEGHSNAGTFVSATNTGDWTTLRGDLLGAWRVLGPLALRATVGIEAPLARPKIVVTIPQTGSDVPLHQANAVGGTATLGVEAHFP